MMYKQIRLLTLLCLFGVLLKAQTPVYLHYGVRDGLPSNLVYCAAQDQEGLLWFGTDKGLVCFDGTRFHTFSMKDGLPDQEVLNLKNDCYGRLWINCFKQKPCFRKNRKLYTEKEDTILAHLTLASGRADVFEIPSENSIWFSDLNRNFYLLKNNQLTSFYLNEPIVRVVKTGQDIIALGERSMFLRLQDGTFKRVFDNIANNPKPLFGYTGIHASGNHFLYSYNYGVRLVAWENGQGKFLEEYKGYIGRIYTDKKGRFWVCTGGKGAVCFDNPYRNLSNPRIYLPGKKISNMFEDQQGTLWFCTLDDGIYALPQKAAMSYSKAEGLPSNNITALSLDADHRIYFGDDEGNIHKIKENKFESLSFGAMDGYNLVRQMRFKPDNSAWIATDENLFYKKNNSVVPLKPIINPKAILLQGDTVWMACSAWLAFLDIQDYKVKTIVTRRFTSIEKDDDGYIWAGSIEGLYSQKDSFRFNWGDLFPALKSRIKFLLKSDNNVLWVSTSGKGLVRVQLKKGAVESVIIVNERIEPDIDYIQSMFMAPDQRLWLATNQGVFGLDPGFHLLNFNQANGLLDNDVNCVLTQNDTIWAGTVAGLSKLVLSKTDNNGAFATFFTTLSYQSAANKYRLNFLDTLIPEKNILLPSDASAITLDMTGLDYAGFGNLRYCCLRQSALLPFPYWTIGNLFDCVQNIWSNAPDTLWLDEGQLDFGLSLLPGNYHLVAYAINPSGIYSQKADEIHLILPPAWYGNLFFWLFFWGFALAGLFRLYRARNAYRDLNESVSNLQLQAIQSQMNPHFVGNSINAIQQFFYPPNPVLASNYIELFTRLLQQTMYFSERHFIGFKEELTYDKDYLELVQLRFGDRFQFEISGADQILPDVLFPAMILQPVLENATIHGLAVDQTSRLQLRFHQAGNQISCIIQDNGVGYNQMQERKKDSDRKSRGLEMLLKKAQAMNKLYKIDLQILLEDLSELDKSMHGTRVSISFDVSKLPKSPDNETLKKRVQSPFKP
jgi:ligand-binding sensor domain-containing protein